MSVSLRVSVSVNLYAPEGQNIGRITFRLESIVLTDGQNIGRITFRLESIAFIRQAKYGWEIDKSIDNDL